MRYYNIRPVVKDVVRMINEDITRYFESSYTQEYNFFFKGFEITTIKSNITGSNIINGWLDVSIEMKTDVSGDRIARSDFYLKNITHSDGTLKDKILDFATLSSMTFNRGESSISFNDDVLRTGVKRFTKRRLKHYAKTKCDFPELSSADYKYIYGELHSIRHTIVDFPETYRKTDFTVLQDINTKVKDAISKHVSSPDFKETVFKEFTQHVDTSLSSILKAAPGAGIDVNDIHRMVDTAWINNIQEL